MNKEQVEKMFNQESRDKKTVGRGAYNMSKGRRASYVSDYIGDGEKATVMVVTNLYHDGRVVIPTTLMKKKGGINMQKRRAYEALMAGVRKEESIC